jgi:hypothetical protein
MKTNQWTAATAAVFTTLAVVSLPCAAQSNSSTTTTTTGNTTTTSTTTTSQSVFPAVPSGWLTAYPTIVQTGTHPTITWGVNYPSVVENYITITESKITAKQEVDCEIRVLGAGVTASKSGSSSYTFVPTEAQVSFNNGTYTRIFYGTNLQVNPNAVVYTKTLQKNKTLCFGGKYFHNNAWGPTYDYTHTHNVRTLVNGSTPPTNIPDFGAPSLEQFIKPYLTADNKVKIGPMDVIVFMELTHSSSQMTDTGFDLQDMVLLVTVKSKAKTNNGHGNNIDGIDSSNPGNAPFINLDTDPEIDDEGHGGGAAPSDP